MSGTIADCESNNAGNAECLYLIRWSTMLNNVGVVRLATSVPAHSRGSRGSSLPGSLDCLQSHSYKTDFKILFKTLQILFMLLTMPKNTKEV